MVPASPPTGSSVPARVLEAERCGDALREQFVPGEPGDPFGRDRGHLEADPAVHEAGVRLHAQARVGGRFGEALHVEPTQAVVESGRQTAGVGQALTQGDATLVVAVELADVARHRQVEVELAFVDQRQHGRDRQPLAGRRDRQLGGPDEVAVVAAVQLGVGGQHRQAAFGQTKLADEGGERLLDRRDRR